MRSARWVVWVIAAASGCAPTLPAAFREAMAAGDRAQHAGRDREAAARYDEASRDASRALDRDEAEFRAAMALARAGDRDAALSRLDGVAARSPDFERGARAAYEAAMIRHDDRDEALRAQGRAGLEALVRQRPATGPARRALARALDDHDALDPSNQNTVSWIDALLTDARVTATPLHDALRAERARRLALSGRRGEAIAAWRSLFADAPYPQNSRWDDGHMALAALLREGGDPRGAVAALDEMLSVRDPSCTGGSCDAPQFQEGAMLRAEILRDDLRDLAGAAAAFHTAYEMFTTSRMRDDALEEEARVRDRIADGSACAVWGRLATEFPCTRRGREGRERARRCGLAIPAGEGGECD